MLTTKCLPDFKMSRDIQKTPSTKCCALHRAITIVHLTGMFTTKCIVEKQKSSIKELKKTVCTGPRAKHSVVDISSRIYGL